MKPMLAEPSKTVAPTIEEAIKRLAPTHLFDVKWDGVRCIATLTPVGVELRNRNGVNITQRYPDVCQHLVDTFQWTTAPLVLDGEIIVLGDDGRPSFNRLARRDRQTSVQGTAKLLRSTPAIFVAFDMLRCQGAELQKTGFEERRRLLEAWWSAHSPERTKLWLSPCGDDGSAMWETVQAHRLEGLIAKRRNSTYHAGRRPEWVKLKVTHHASCVVTGWEEGKGHRKGRIGALLLSLWDGDHLVEVGKAGTGLTDDVLAHYLPLVRAGEPFVVEVEYANVTDDGRLRFPSHKGLRTDVQPDQCTIDQLKGIPA